MQTAGARAAASLSCSGYFQASPPGAVGPVEFEFPRGSSGTGRRLAADADETHARAAADAEQVRWQPQGGRRLAAGGLPAADGGAGHGGRRLAAGEDARPPRRTVALLCEGDSRSTVSVVDVHPGVRGIEGTAPPPGLGVPRAGGAVDAAAPLGVEHLAVVATEECSAVAKTFSGARRKTSRPLFFESRCSLGRLGH